MEQPFVFVHITDIHLQRRNTESSYIYFRHFVQDVLPVIQPALVVNTGDITQSQQLDLKENLQRDEWILYSSVLKEFGWFDENKWLDIRGNHDAFVHYPEPQPYKEHTVYGATGKSCVYSKVVETTSGRLRFIGIDANDPLFRHFNGFLTVEIMDAVEALFQNESLPTIVFTHYPLFTMDLRVKSSQGHSFKDLLRIHKPLFYLCGHMHSALGGMITKQFDTIEAELFDFKTSHQFRIYSYFRGKLSFLTYNLNIDDKPIVILHSPIDYRYQLQNDENRLVFFTILNTANPKIDIMIDGHDFSNSSNLIIKSRDQAIDVYFEPLLQNGKHELQCTITNEFQKTTLFQRVFEVQNMSCDKCIPAVPSLTALTHVQLGELTTSDITAGYALEYPTSSKVKLLMKTDWSFWMLVLNPLIIIIIILFYSICRKVGVSLLEKQASLSFTGSFSYKQSPLFPSDRSFRASLLHNSLRNIPWFLRVLFERLFLFTSDSYIFYGVMTSLACRWLLPHFYRDELGDWCMFTILGFWDLRTGKHSPTMDTYVFGAAFYYVMLVVFTLYMFFFAAPSVTKSIPYTIVSYLVMMVDVGLFGKYFHWCLEGRRRKYLRSLLSLLLQLNDGVSMVILFLLMVREKCL